MGRTEDDASHPAQAGAWGEAHDTGATHPCLLSTRIGSSVWTQIKYSIAGLAWLIDPKNWGIDWLYALYLGGARQDIKAMPVTAPAIDPPVITLPPVTERDGKASQASLAEIQALNDRGYVWKNFEGGRHVYEMIASKGRYPNA